MSPEPLSQSTMILPVSSTPMTVPRVPTGGACASSIWTMGEQKEYQIGVWGQRYKRHLKSNHRVIYYNYLTSGRLYEHLAEVDTRAEVMFHELVKTLAEKENVTEKLKAENTLLWIRKMNNIRNRATEIVNVEVIYV